MRVAASALALARSCSAASGAARVASVARRRTCGSARRTSPSRSSSPRSARRRLEARGLRVERRYELGGNLAHDALVAGEIDVYPEYTGTSLMAILKHPPDTDARAVYEQRQGASTPTRFDVEVGPPLGFEQHVRHPRARRRRAPPQPEDHLGRRAARAGLARGLRAGLHVARRRLRGLRARLRSTVRARPREMDLSLSYRALAEGQVDVIAGNSTDGMIVDARAHAARRRPPLLPALRGRPARAPRRARTPPRGARSLAAASPAPSRPRRCADSTTRLTGTSDPPPRSCASGDGEKGCRQ